MQNYVNSVAYDNGSVIAGASVSVYLTGTTTLATLYSSNSLSGGTKTNPLTTDSNGSYSFYAPNGCYDISINNSGVTITLPRQVLFDPITPGSPWLPLSGYSPDSTGVTPSDTALTAAIAALALVSTNGGTIDLGPGIFTFANPINLDNKFGIGLRGRGGKSAGANPATTIQYSGTGTGNWINLNSAIGCELRDTMITYTSASYTGSQVQCSNDGTNSDPAFCGVYDCTFSGVPRTASHILLNKCEQFVIQRCNFIQANASGAIIGAASGQYSNVVTIKDTQFADNTAAPIQGGGTEWTIQGCTFENLHNNEAGAYLGTTSTPQQGMSWVGNYFGDVTVAGNYWLTGLFNGFVFEGNLIGSTTNDANGIDFLTGSSGYEVVGNYVIGLNIWLNWAGACGAGTITPNSLVTVTTAYSNQSNVAGYWSGTQGYSAMPDGSIMQRGSAPVTFSVGGTANAVTYPQAFLTSNATIILTVTSPTSASDFVSVSSPSTTGFSIEAYGTAGTGSVNWIAWGN